MIIKVTRAAQKNILQSFFFWEFPIPILESFSIRIIFYGNES